MTRRFYVDTSAYLCILLGEDGHESLTAEMTGAELLSSVLLVLETRRTLVRLAREGVLTDGHYAACAARLEEDLDLFVLRDLTPDLCGAQPMPAVTTPRSLDLVHLRTAAWFHQTDPVTRFVTLDRAQAEAARELGLPI